MDLSSSRLKTRMEPPLIIAGAAVHVTVGLTLTRAYKKGADTKSLWLSIVSSAISLLIYIEVSLLQFRHSVYARNGQER